MDSTLMSPELAEALAVADAPPRPGRASGSDQAVKPICLALQGGGAHGAFTWGILDRLLEDDRLEIEGISATSAGAMNAACVAYGMAIGGCAEARRTLASFWDRIAQAAAFSPLQPSWYDKLARNWGLEFSPAFVGFDIVSRLFSPYEFNPFNLNSLKQVLESTIEFEELRKPTAPVRLFISATNVRTGKVKVFQRPEICADAVLASACLPFMFQAVEIDGEAYWDGGYMGNPAIFPLIYGCDSRDVVIVHINPLERPDVPQTARDILNRINEISFNSSLMREMRAINFVTDLIDTGQLCRPDLRRMLVHSISADEIMITLGVSSKLNADRDFLEWLRDHGRQCAEAWLAQNYDALGRRSTVDIRTRFL